MVVGKELSHSKKLSDYVGKNEKTTIVAKLQKRGGGAPVREAAIDEQTQKEMMAFAYKKQQEWKVGHPFCYHDLLGGKFVHEITGIS